MKPDKKQTVQLVVLGVLVVVFVGFLSFNFLGPKGAKKTSTASGGAQPTTTATPAGDARAGGAEAQEEASTVVFPNLASVPARRDPFVAQSLPGSAAERPPVVMARPQPSRINPFRAPVTRVPSISIPPVNPFGGERSAVVSPADRTEPDPEPSFVVTGILRGEGNVVILKSGDNNRYVVKQGQMIDGRYRVLYVTSDGVVLAHKNRRIHVKLGGDKNAS